MEKTEAEHQSSFATEPVGRLIAKFAIPCVISLLVNSLYNIVDQIFIGWGVGYIGNGATNVVFPITIVALALSLMIGDGGAAYLSLKLGEGDTENARKGVGNAVSMVVVVSIVLAAVFLGFLAPILNLFGATDALLPYAIDYGSIIGIGLPFMMISGALNSIIRADGSPKIRDVLDDSRRGDEHNPRSGLHLLLRDGRTGRGHRDGARAGRLVRRVRRLYWAVQDAASAAFGPPPEGEDVRQHPDLRHQQLYHAVRDHHRHGADEQPARLLRRGPVYGSEIPLTATGIVMKVNQILISILVGIAVGTQPIIGFNYGAKNYTRVKKAPDIALVISEIISIAAFLIFQFAPMSVVSVFGSEEGLYNEFAVLAFRIFLLLCPLTGFQTVVAVYLQAVGKPLKSAILSLARQIIFFVPAALILPIFLGVTGVLWTGPVADGLAFVLSVILLVYERKQLKKAEARAVPDRKGEQTA